MEKLSRPIRQEQLARAALELIEAEGLAGLSVARVARKVGLVPSALYRHYAGKDALLEAVVALIRERLHGNVAAIIEESPDALERLRRLATAHVRVIRENRGIMRVVFSDELYRGRPTVKAAIYEMVRGYLEQIAAIVRQGQRAGRIRADLDPAAVAVMFLGLIQPAAILWRLSGGTFDVRKQVARAWPVFRAAIAAE